MQDCACWRRKFFGLLKLRTKPKLDRLCGIIELAAVGEGSVARAAVCRLVVRDVGADLIMAPVTESGFSDLCNIA